MNKYTQLRDALKGLQATPTTLLTAKVLSVEGDTCTIELGDAKLDGVRLRPTECEIDTKLLVTPKAGSYVMLGSQSGDMRDCNVLMVEEPKTISIDSEKLTLLIDIENGKIIVNKGSLGGMVKIRPLTQRLIDIETVLNNLVEDYNEHGHTVTCTCGLEHKLLQASEIGSAGETNPEELEDKNFTH